MKITEIKLHTVKSGDAGARGAAVGESQYWGGGWQAQTLISNPMSVHPEYSRIRSLWMSGGQDPYVIEIFADAGVTGFCANYGGGKFACAVIEKHFKRFLVGTSLRLTLRDKERGGLRMNFCKNTVFIF